jgi:uncharacterized protein YciI
MGAADRGMPRVDFELESYTFELLLKGDRYDDFDDDTFAELNKAHIEHALSLRASGTLLAAGALEGNAGTAVCGLGFYRVTPEEAKQLGADDPAVRAGMYRLETFRFTGPKGGLAFPLSAEHR